MFMTAKTDSQVMSMKKFSSLWNYFLKRDNKKKKIRTSARRKIAFTTTVEEKERGKKSRLSFRRTWEIMLP